jgi:Tfp pilus assembly protein PilV
MRNIGKQTGQVLVEIMVASVLLLFISLGIVEVLSTSARSIDQTMNQVVAVFLGQEEGEALRAISREDWHFITNLATSSSNTYFATSSSGKWATTSGNEAVVLNSISYTRSFYLSDVYRSTSSATSTGDIVGSGGYYDPSTSKATIQISWTDPGTGASNTFNQTLYVSRYLNTTFAQTDWSGGGLDTEATTAVATTTFTTSTGIDYASTTGSILLQPQAGQ